LNPRPLGYEHRRHCSTPGSIWRTCPAFPGRTPVVNGSFAAARPINGIEHAEIAAGKAGEVAGDQDQSPGPGRGGQEAVDGGERVANVQVPPTLRDLGWAAVTEYDERVKQAVVAPHLTPTRSGFWSCCCGRWPNADWLVLPDSPALTSPCALATASFVASAACRRHRPVTRQGISRARRSGETR